MGLDSCICCAGEILESEQFNLNFKSTAVPAAGCCWSAQIKLLTLESSIEQIQIACELSFIIEIS